MIGAANAGNVWLDYADIDRGGTVDYADLALFATEWLWDANDPSTW
jgi:hypothetical protein